MYDRQKNPHAFLQIILKIPDCDLRMGNSADGENPSCQFSENHHFAGTGTASGISAVRLVILPMPQIAVWTAKNMQIMPGAAIFPHFLSQEINIFLFLI